MAYSQDIGIVKPKHFKKLGSVFWTPETTPTEESIPKHKMICLAGIGSSPDLLKLLELLSRLFLLGGAGIVGRDWKSMGY